MLLINEIIAYLVEGSKTELITCIIPFEAGIEATISAFPFTKV